MADVLDRDGNPVLPIAFVSNTVDPHAAALNERAAAKQQDALADKKHTDA